MEEASPVGFHHIPASRTCIPLSTFFPYQCTSEQKLGLDKGQQVSQLAATVPKDSLPQWMISLHTFNRNKRQAQSRCVPPKSETRRKWTFLGRKDSIRRVQMNTKQMAIQSGIHRLHVARTRPATEQAHIAAETASLGNSVITVESTRTQGHKDTVEATLLSFKLPKQAFPPLEACSAKTQNKKKTLLEK